MGGKQGASPVSYTHLDVYKRQALDPLQVPFPFQRVQVAPDRYDCGTEQVAKLGYAYLSLLFQKGEDLFSSDINSASIFLLHGCFLPFLKSLLLYFNIKWLEIQFFSTNLIVSLQRRLDG